MSSQKKKLVIKISTKGGFGSKFTQLQIEIEEDDLYKFGKKYFWQIKGCSFLFKCKTD